jgi:hypothetical protein
MITNQQTKLLEFYFLKSFHNPDIGVESDDERNSSHTKDNIVLMMTVRTSETSVYFNETTRRCIPEGYDLHTWPS